MEDRERTQQFASDGNGRYLQPASPVYVANVPYSQTDVNEWNLRQLLTVVRRRAFVMGSVAIALSGAVWLWTLTREAKYEGQFSLLVEPVNAENKLSKVSELPIAPPRNSQENLDYGSQIIVLRSPQILAPIAKQISTRYPEIDYGTLASNLKISRFADTKILQVSYEDSDPQRIQFVLEQLAKGFLKYSLQERQTNLQRGIDFVDTQMPQLRGRVNSLQIQLQRFREQYNLSSPDDRATILYQRANALEAQRLDIQRQLATTRQLYATLQGRSGAQLALQAEAGALDLSAQSTESNSSLSGALQNRSGAPEAQDKAPIYQSLVNQLREIETKIASAATVYRQDSPMVQALQRKRESLLPVLQQEAARALGNKLVEVTNQISLLEVQATKNAQAIQNSDREIGKLPGLARRYSDLQRELVIATDSLTRFLQRRESLQIENAQKETPWEMIAQPGVSTDPVSPKVPRNLILGAIAGLLAGMAAALLTEKLDNGFHSPEDLKEATKLPLLGTIPFHKNLHVTEAEQQTNARDNSSRSRRNRSSYGYNYFPFLESFRSLYTNIGFLGSDTPVHSLVISSSVHAEGKSTTASFLAQAAAAMGRRVLLVDADLRLPQIHRILQLSNETGLSNAITTNVPVADLIQRSPAWENLYILTAGTIPPDPTKLLSSHKMRNIMEQLRQQFDLVIYDTPPMLGLADASLIAPYTAGLAIVTRMDKTDRAMLTQALDQLKLSRTQILGAICNGVKDYKATTSYYQYYYQPRTQSAG